MAFKIAVVAYVYVDILISPGHILGGFYSWLLKKLTVTTITEFPDNAPYEVQQMQGYEPRKLKRIEKRERKILKVVGGCVYCTAGQMALWVFVVNQFFPNLILQTVAEGVFTICFSILIVRILKKFL